MTIPLLLFAVALDLREVAPAKHEMKDPVTGVPVTVRVDGFMIARTETTQAEYEAVMGRNPSRFRGARRPVENVTWWEAIAFANALSVREQKTPCYELATGRRLACDGYRLPTEAEWMAANGENRAGHLGVASTKDTGVFAGRETAEADERMAGNVWEWCGDWFAPEYTPWPVHNPRGPLRGLEKVIRGGSYVSTTGSWARQYRSGREPGWRSPRTGFRLVRSTGVAAPMETKPLPAPRVSAAPAHWQRALGAMKIAPPAPETRLVDTIHDARFRAELRQLRTEPDAWEKMLVVYPDEAITSPRPVLIVPYYDVDTPIGLPLGGRNYLPPGVRSYAWLAAQQGWIAIAVRWFGESYAERYDEAVAELRERHPDASGLGKWVWDAQRLLDWIATQPQMDAQRVGMMGHSLGGKMTLYAMAFDARIRVGVASEPGISLKFSNYDDYWYLGERIRHLPAGADHHELLRMIAPRPFHLIGGEDSDGEKSRAILERASEPGFDLPFTNHKAGHTPTPASIGEAFAWLGRYLNHR